MAQFRKYEIRHEPQIDRFWAVKVPINFKVFGPFSELTEEHKAGDYITIETKDGYVRIKSADEMKKAVIVKNK